jgi:hypothetical protein
MALADDMDHLHFLETNSTSGISQTSYASSLFSGNESLSIPSAPKESADKAPFECPYCRLVITIKNSKDWARHVFRDLMPYVCLSPNCNTPSKLYESRRQWYHHMCEAHSILENGSNCPLCLVDIQPPLAFERHVGHHLEQLALFVLPRIEPEDEVSCADSVEAASTQTFEDSSESDDIAEIQIESSVPTVSLNGRNIDDLLSSTSPRITERGRERRDFLSEEVNILEAAQVEGNSRGRFRKRDLRPAVRGGSKSPQPAESTFVEGSFIEHQSSYTREEERPERIHTLDSGISQNNFAYIQDSHLKSQLSRKQGLSRNRLASTAPELSTTTQFGSSPLVLVQNAFSYTTPREQFEREHSEIAAEPARFSDMRAQTNRVHKSQPYERRRNRESTSEEDQEEYSPRLEVTSGKARSDDIDPADFYTPLTTSTGIPTLEGLFYSQEAHIESNNIPPSFTKVTGVPPKGILRRPMDSVPEDTNPVREGVAPIEDSTKTEIPPGARWTRIDRSIVNPEALRAGNERFEERSDCVIVLRVLTKDEIQTYAEKTREIRGI